MNKELYKSFRGDNIYRCDLLKLDDNNSPISSDFCFIHAKDDVSAYALLKYALSLRMNETWSIQSISRVIPCNLTDLAEQYIKLVLPENV